MRQFRAFSDLDLLYVIFPCEQRFLSSAWLLAFTKSFAWLIRRVVGLFTPVNYAIDRQATRMITYTYAKSHAREKPLLVG